MEIEERIVAVRCDITINNTTIRAVVDTGAATNIMTSSLLRQLNLEIEESSKTRFIIANGERQASLGKTEIEIEVNDWIIPVKVEVIESRKKELLLGTKFLAEMKGLIDLEKQTMTLKIEEQDILIPIYYSQKQLKEDEIENDTSESENTDEYDNYEETDEEIDLNVTLTDDEETIQTEDNEVKQPVLASSAERH